MHPVISRPSNTCTFDLPPSILDMSTLVRFFYTSTLNVRALAKLSSAAIDRHQCELFRLFSLFIGEKKIK